MGWRAHAIGILRSSAARTRFWHWPRIFDFRHWLTVEFLPRVGNWPTWEDYCCQVAGFSKSYASWIMKTSRLASDLCKKLPIGNSVKLVSESQVRPLLQLQEYDQQEQAWVAAVKKSEGKQPTAAIVQKMVFEILHPEGPAEPSQSRSQRRSEVVSRLREVVAQRKSWAQVEQLMEELEELL